jgi:hypothetical protein
LARFYFFVQALLVAITAASAAVATTIAAAVTHAHAATSAAAVPVTAAAAMTATALVAEVARVTGCRVAGAVGRVADVIVALLIAVRLARCTVRRNWNRPRRHLIAFADRDLDLEAGSNLAQFVHGLEKRLARAFLFLVFPPRVVAADAGIGRSAESLLNLVHVWKSFSDVMG